MVCIYCRRPTKVTNSRRQLHQPGTWRRRQCVSCGARFTSLERADYSRSLVFQAENGVMRPFERDRLLLSLYEACRHRSAALEDAAALSDTIMNKLLRSCVQPGLVARGDLIRITLETLQPFDQAAAVYYRVYHTCD